MTIETLSLLSESNIVIEIEEIVRKIYMRAYDNDYSILRNKITQNIERYLTTYNPKYLYSECLEAFWSACQESGVLLSGSIVSQEQLNQMIAAILKYIRTPTFRRAVVDRNYQKKQNMNSIEDYASLLHEKYARLLVIRVDLGYREDNQHLITIEKHYHFLDTLNKERCTNPLFQHLVGHAWCVEQGETKGYHIHAVYYFKGSEHQNDWYKAKQIGELWQHLTNNLGTYHSCNTPQEKEKYQKNDKLGVGMIHRKDSKSRENAVMSVRYLSDVKKLNQYLRIRPKGRRVFGTGMISSL